MRLVPVGQKASKVKLGLIGRFEIARLILRFNGQIADTLRGDFRVFYEATNVDPLLKFATLRQGWRLVGFPKTRYVEWH